MLVLSRKVQERIQVGDNITITIVRVKGQTVRVGIEAPRDVRVMRAELSEHKPSGETDGKPSAGEPADVVVETKPRSARKVTRSDVETSGEVDPGWQEPSVVPSPLGRHLSRVRNEQLDIGQVDVEQLELVLAS